MATAKLSYLLNTADTGYPWKNAYYHNTPIEWNLSQGYPKKLVSPLAWKAEDVTKRQPDWYLQLDQDDIKAIESALATFEAQYGTSALNLSNIGAKTFQLPRRLIERLRNVSNQCYHDIGFKIIRGLDPAKYSPFQNMAIYAGLTSHIAPQRGFVDINYRTVISHIVNVANEKPKFQAKAPPGFSSSALSFHTDNCEILGLYCLGAAAEGGTSLLASSWNIYNELATNRPDILKTLTEEWILDTFRDYNIAPPRYRRPYDFSDINNITMRFSRYGITGWLSERNPALPAPTASQIEAIDTVQVIAAANCVKLDLRSGDMMFLNDMAIMHGRTAFTEQGEFMKRHFLKMLLHDPAQDWPIADASKADWIKIYGPNRPDGTRVEEWDIDYQAGRELEGLDNG